MLINKNKVKWCKATTLAKEYKKPIKVKCWLVKGHKGLHYTPLRVTDKNWNKA